jgi:hypothetical protein
LQILNSILLIAVAFSFQTSAKEANLANDSLRIHASSKSISTLNFHSKSSPSKLAKNKNTEEVIDLLVFFQPNYIELIGYEAALNRVDRWVEKINESVASAGSNFQVRLVNAESAVVLNDDSVSWSDSLDEEGNSIRGVLSIIEDSIYNNSKDNYESQAVEKYRPDLIMFVRDYRSSDDLGNTLGMASYKGELSVIFDDVSKGIFYDFYDQVAAHEIGHNLGAHHEVESIVDGEYEPKARAFSCVFNTVMWSTINDDNHQFFSDPFRTYEGEFCGDLETANNSKVVLKNAEVVSTRRNQISPDGEVFFSKESYAFGEKGGAGLIQLSRTGDLSNSVSVDIVLQSASAKLGFDVKDERLRVVFNEGEAESNALIHIVDDGLVEGQEYLNAYLRFPSGITISDASVMINLDDGALGSNGEFVVSVSSSVYEGQPVTVSVNRINGTTGENFIIIDAVSGPVEPSATPNRDFVAGTWQLSFADGEESKTIQIQTIDDLIYEQDEVFGVYASNYLGVPINNAQNLVLILNNDNDYTDNLPDLRGEFIIEVDTLDYYEDEGSIEVNIYRINGDDTFENLVFSISAIGNTDSDVIQEFSDDILFVPGMSALEISVPIKDNSTYSGESTSFLMSISSNSSATILNDNLIVTVFENELKPNGWVAEGSSSEMPGEPVVVFDEDKNNSAGSTGALLMLLVFFNLARWYKVKSL